MMVVKRLARGAGWRERSSRMGLVPKWEGVFGGTFPEDFADLAGRSSILGMFRVIDDDGMRRRLLFVSNHLAKEFQFGT
jgi:hypothetical protein